MLEITLNSSEHFYCSVLQTLYIYCIFSRGFFMYLIQHCFSCRPSDSTVSENAGIDHRTQDFCDFGIGCQTLSSTQLDLIHLYSYNRCGGSKPNIWKVEWEWFHYKRSRNGFEKKKTLSRLYGIAKGCSERFWWWIFICHSFRLGFSLQKAQIWHPEHCTNHPSIQICKNSACQLCAQKNEGNHICT